MVDEINSSKIIVFSTYVEVIPKIDGYSQYTIGILHVCGGDPEPGRLIMNAKWIYPAQIPFLLAHEIGHVLHENACFYHISDLTANKGEASENIFAIKLLQKYCVENEIYFDTWYKFAKCFGIPKECYYLLELIA